MKKSYRCLHCFMVVHRILAHSRLKHSGMVIIAEEVKG